MYGFFSPDEELFSLKNSGSKAVAKIEKTNPPHMHSDTNMVSTTAMPVAEEKRLLFSAGFVLCSGWTAGWCSHSSSR